MCLVITVKIVRSTKCTLKYATAAKRAQVAELIDEYIRTVNFFIGYYWGDCPDAKDAAVARYANLADTWLGATLRQHASREAIEIISNTCLSRGSENGIGSVPIYAARGVHIRAKTCADIRVSKNATHFRTWLHLSNLASRESEQAKFTLDLPLVKHKHFERLASLGVRLNSVILTEQYIQFAFEIETGKKRETGPCLGVDTGIKALATLSTGEQYGTDIEQCIERIKRCKQGSKGQKRARRALRHRMDETAKEVVTTTQAQWLVVEKLRKMNNQTKVRRRLNKNMRRSIGSWNYRYWLGRLEQTCEMNRVHFARVNPAYTSQRCPACGCTDRRNRPTQEKFLCQQCGYTDHADVNAAKNILARFLSGVEGP